MQRVEIRLRGQLDRNWQEWFEDFNIHPGEQQQTILTGKIYDQTTLYALLNRLERLGLQLVSLQVKDLPETEILSLEEQTENEDSSSINTPTSPSS